MNEAEVGAQLRHALELSGGSPWELSRRADVKLEFVEALLLGSGAVPLRAVCRVAHALELQLLVVPAQGTGRMVGSVPTVVDHAVDRLNKAPSSGSN